MRYFGPSAEEAIEDLKLDISCFNSSTIRGKGSAANLNEDMCNIVKKMFNYGVKMMSIAKCLGLSSNTVSAIVNDRYVPVDDCDMRIDKGKIRALYTAGWNIKDIAGDCCVTVDIVKDVLREKTHN